MLNPLYGHFLLLPMMLQECQEFYTLSVTEILLARRPSLPKQGRSLHQTLCWAAC